MAGPPPKKALFDSGGFWLTPNVGTENRKMKRWARAVLSSGGQENNGYAIQASDDSPGVARQNQIAAAFTVLVEVARQLGSLYDAAEATPTQQHYIETILGAALWYLPTSKELWTGGISVKALADFHPDSGLAKPKLTEDHEFPRKVSAVELMRRTWDENDPAASMLDLYLQKYGRYNYITPTENKVLVKFQKTHVFAEPSIAYAKAGVSLVTVSLSELKAILKRDRGVIATCAGRRVA